jgi:hypothetical protein
MSFFPLRSRAQKEHFFLARRTPGSHVRPVQIHFAVCKPTGNVDSRKAAVAFADTRDVGNSKAAIQFRYVQNCIHNTFVERIRMRPSRLLREAQPPNLQTKDQFRNRDLREKA